MARTLEEPMKMGHTDSQQSDGSGSSDLSEYLEAACSADHKPDDALGAPIWPALLAILLETVSISITVPYLSMVAAQAPYAREHAAWDAEHNVTASAAGHRGKGAAMVYGQDIISSASMAQAFMHFLTAGLLGVLVDRLGPRFVGLFAVMGQLVKLGAVFLCAPVEPGLPPFAISSVYSTFVLTFAFAGLTGHIRPPAMALVAKRSSLSDRSRNFGLASAAGTAGFCLGQAANIAVGHLAGRKALRQPLLIAFLLETAIFFLVLLFWPEHKKESDPAPWADAVPWQLMKKTFCISGSMLLVGGMVLIDNIGKDMAHSVFIVFARARFDFDTESISMLLMAGTLMSPFILALLLPRLIRCRGEMFVLRFASVMMLLHELANFAVGLQTNGNLLYLGVPMGVLSHMGEPMLSSFGSRELPVDLQGRLQGAFSLLGIFAAFVAPYVATKVMHKTIDSDLPSAVYLAAAAITLPGTLMAFCLRPKKVKGGEPGSEGSSDSGSESPME